MKTKIKYILLFALFAFLCFTTCQDEITDVGNPTEQETIVANSTLSSLLSRTSANFGAIDDFLDGSSCFSLQLPATVIINDVSILIENEADLEQLQDVFNDDLNDADMSDFVFPITIVFSNYSEVVIENESQLQNYRNDCIGDENEVIDCVDIVYPISFSVFNSQFNLINTVAIQNDEALYIFLEGLDDDENALIASINYPVALEYANRELIEVTTNEELSDAILAADEHCQEAIECTVPNISSILQECSWDFSDGSSDFENYQMIFNSNGDLQITEGMATSAIGGAWSLSNTANGILLKFSELTAFNDHLGGDWFIIECDDNRLEIVREDTTFVLEKDCESDNQFNLQETNALLLECYWPFVTSLYDNIVGEMFDFQENNVLQILNLGTHQVQETGVWNLSVTDSDLILTIELSQNSMISLEWVFTEFEANRFVLNNGNDTLTIEQDCDSFNNPFNCFSNFELVECENATGEAEFNLSADTVGLIVCPVGFTASFHTSESDAEANVEEIVNTESYNSVQAEIYLRIEAESGNFEIFSIFLNTEACVDFDCFVNTEISSCSENNDSFATFNLTEANNDCSIYAIYGLYYFETESDAQNFVNPITTPLSYTNVFNPAVIYAAIINVNGNVVEHIFTIALIPENCNLFECFQGFDAQLEVCDNGTDGPYEFNLPIAFSNCTPSADIITYHETQVDAVTGVNAFANPSAYTTANVSSTIYTRVEIGSQFEVFPIQLFIIDCNEPCSETDVDGILLECIWNVVSYNGSDNLIDYNLNFEENSGIVVIYNESTTIDASWSTSEINEGVIIVFSNVAGPNIQAIDGSWKVVECTDTQLVLHNINDSSNEMVLQRTCN